jgi:hypothetical protein
MKSSKLPDTPRDEVVKPKPDLIEVTLIDGVFANGGQPFSLNVRADQGDTLKDGPKYLLYTNGVTGQTIRLTQAHIAMLMTVTKMVEKPKSKAIKPLEP